MPSKPTEIAMVGDTPREGRLAYVYRLDPKVPIVAAIKRVGPPKVRCAYDPFSPTRVLCRPQVPLAWMSARAVRFGPEGGKWATELVFGSAQPRDFAFAVPKGWPAIFHQFVYEDGRASAIERLEVQQ